MDKGIILKEVNEVFQVLKQQKEKLNNLLMSPVWEELIREEMDQTITAMYDLDDIIGQLMEVQHNIVIAPNKPIEFKRTGENEFEKFGYCKGDACGSIGIRAVFQNNKDSLESLVFQNNDNKLTARIRIHLADKSGLLSKSPIINVPPMEIVESKVDVPNLTGYYKIVARFEKSNE
jgi:hypothetical protein